MIFGGWFGFASTKRGLLIFFDMEKKLFGIKKVLLRKFCIYGY